LSELRREGGTVRFAQTSDSERDEKVFRVPPEVPLFVEPSVILLLRRFPFRQPVEQRLFATDFSGHGLWATLALGGRERVPVPAGEFDCYRMELTLQMFLFRPKILLWVSVEPPHFLVKQVGKRGAFTPRYVTELLAVLPSEAQ
jgi:hypothetical protein